MSVRRSGKKWAATARISGMKPKYKTFPSKRAALLWVEETKDDMRRQLEGLPAKMLTVKDMLERYRDTITTKKKGKHWESLRIRKILKSDIAEVHISKINGSHIADWRDTRLTQVSSSTVNRELNIICHAFSLAVDEWCWLQKNPTKKIRRPINPPPRDRRISDQEIEKLIDAMDYSEDSTFDKNSHRLAVAFLFSIETAMRLGEVCSLKWSDIRRNVARIENTKNGHARNVPLSKRAVELLHKLPKDKDTIFGLTSQQSSALFRRCRDKTDVQDIVYHDTRHEAITRLAEKLKVLDLARMTGHRDINMLQIYYNERPEQIASKLD